MEPRTARGTQSGRAGFIPQTTKIEYLEIDGCCIPKYINEFWTSKQRQGSSIQEISYRACFKPQLPGFFIKLLTREDDIVYDSFSGRGTTVVEAGLLGRRVISNDINPLSEILSRPRFFVPFLSEVKNRLAEIPLNQGQKADIDISMFYHPDTESEIVGLKKYLMERADKGEEDDLDRWIRMVATNRLTGHSRGFFSAYTLPPNQAVTPERQVKINLKRKQNPEYRDTRSIILKKSGSLIRNLTAGQVKNLKKAGETAVFLKSDARNTYRIKSNSVQLTVTSPPFLDIVQYSSDNWLRCWFNSIDEGQIEKKITMSRNVEDWTSVMGEVFKELFRITGEGGWAAFEVGEVKNGSLNLEEYVVPLGLKAGFTCEGIMINMQEFTKTSNIWGINNNKSGTNTNRIILFKKG
ncbi:MAG: DNA modification methylase [Firmicutes bacterium HGW-Firmicutes-13]|nr:MAG: DNA modification methylase [Firmicutes bacterium HGW-Firmicutes-13]